MQHLQSDVQHFMELAQQETPKYPFIPTPEVRKLRAKLILEEALEQCQALGVEITTTAIGAALKLDEAGLQFHPVNQPDITLIADGICDQLYVSIGTGVAFGLDLAPIWKLVHEANLAKFGPGSYRRDDGKQMKPPGWVAPDEAIRLEIQSQVHA